METKSVRITVAGRVQGVFYRKSTKDQADRFGVLGTVKNQSDGSVLIEATGAPENVEKLINWCRQGPPASKVEAVQIEEISSLNYENFSISYF